MWTPPPDAATVNPSQTQPNATAPAAPPAVPADFASTDAENQAQYGPAAAAPTPGNGGKPSFGQKVIQSANPQYTTDEDGNVQPVYQKAGPKSVLGAVLMGALKSVTAAVNSQTPAGVGSRSGAVSSAMAASNKAQQDSDAKAQAAAKLQFDNEQKAKNDRLNANIKLANLHDLTLKAYHDEQEFEWKEQAHKDKAAADTDQRLKDSAAQTQILNTASQNGLIKAPIEIDPNDAEGMKQLTSILPDLVGNRATAIHNGQRGEDGRILVFSNDDLNTPIPFGVNYTVPTYSDSMYDPTKGEYVPKEVVYQGDGKTTFRQLVYQYQAADEQLAKLQANHNGSMGRDAQNQKEKPNLDKLLSNPETATGEKAPATIAFADSIISDQTASPADVAKAQRLKTMANSAMKISETQKSAEKAAEAQAAESAKNGDPESSGELLYNGSMAPSQLQAKSNPAFLKQAVAAANAYGKAHGGQEISPGVYYSAQVAEGQFAAAKSSPNVGFFGNVNSLLDQGGTLDQLTEAGKSIPASQFPVVNSLDDIRKIQSGNGPLAGYAATVVGVADDYSKVMTGSAGSDASRELAAAMFNPKFSPEQRQDAINAARAAIKSQAAGRIGTNRVLAQMYGYNVQDNIAANNAHRASAQNPPANKTSGTAPKTDPGGFFVKPQPQGN